MGRRARIASTSISRRVTPAVLDLPRRDDLQVADLLGRLGAAVGLDDADRHVHALPLEAVSLAEHGVGLAHAGRRAEVDLEPSPLLAADQVEELLGSGTGRFDDRHGMTACKSWKTGTLLLPGICSHHAALLERGPSLVELGPKLMEGFPCRLHALVDPDYLLGQRPGPGRALGHRGEPGFEVLQSGRRLLIPGRLDLLAQLFELARKALDLSPHAATSPVGAGLGGGAGAFSAPEEVGSGAALASLRRAPG